MDWKKRGTANTLEEVIEQNSGLPAEVLLHPAPVDPRNIRGMPEAAERIKRAIDVKETILVYGDYDCDGITSAAILALGLRSLGADVRVNLPRRFTDGYGLPKDLDIGCAKLIVTVDNGIAAVDAMEQIREKGADVIIMDHHLPGAELPDANIIIDQHIYPEESDHDSFRFYCGAGLSLKLCELLMEKKTLLRRLTVLAAIGTVADVMPLVGDNRRIVKEGIAYMADPDYLVPGLRCLLELSKTVQPDEESIVFRIGPILNAPGRLEDDGAKRSLSCLLAKELDAMCLAQDIIDLNEQRKEIVKQFYNKALQAIESDCLYGSAPICIYIPGMPEGISGIIAGRSAEKFLTPAIVFADSASEPDVLKGSGRSYGGVNLHELLAKVPAGLLLKHGGHEAAAGLSINSGDYPKLVRELMELLSAYEAPESAAIEYDLECSGEELLQILEQVQKYAPYGEGNPRPVFLVKDIVLSPRYGASFKLMGDDHNHLKLYGNGYDIIAFGMAQQFIELGQPKRVDAVGSINRHTFEYATSNQLTALDFQRAADTRASTSSLLVALRENRKIS